MNRKIGIQATVVILITLMFSSCIGDLFGITGKGNIVTQTRSVKDFQSITLNNAAKVNIVKGDSFKVEVSDYENIVQYLSVKVTDHNLMISTDPIYTLLVNSQAKVTITMPDSLINVSLNGSGDININSAFKDLKSAIIIGSGNINANQTLNISSLNASIVGSGNITAKGNVSTLTALITGSGNLLLSNLNATAATCTISGSGNINVGVVNSLKATISGSGNVIYSGTPTVDVSITGSGKVLHN
jgi:hypothetical protein